MHAWVQLGAKEGHALRAHAWIRHCTWCRPGVGDLVKIGPA